MNERIKELVGQAKFMAEEDINKKISLNQELNAFAEKFAELIVRECTEVIQKEKDWMLNSTPDLDNVNSIISGLSVSKALIKKTFRS